MLDRHATPKFANLPNHQYFVTNRQFLSGNNRYGHSSLQHKCWHLDTRFLWACQYQEHQYPRQLWLRSRVMQETARANGGATYRQCRTSLQLTVWPRLPLQKQYFKQLKGRYCNRWMQVEYVWLHGPK